MAWDLPYFKTQDYNLAGKVLVQGSCSEMEMDQALYIINNWRSSHYHPLNTFQLRLRRKAQEVDSNSLVAQRIKRLYSIKHKLERFPTMRLTQIQDIGGCRAIVSTNDHLKVLVDIIASRDKKRSSRGIKHKLVDEKNYIEYPKPSGYRGVHLVYRYHSDKTSEYDGLKIEIQFRTFLQHAWATAVETVGIFIGQALKSSMGHSDWLRYFALASSAMAIYEGTPTVSDIDMTPDEIRLELRRLSGQLNVHSHLTAYREAMKIFEGSDLQGMHYYLLSVNVDDKVITVSPFKQGQLEEASLAYLELERKSIGKNIDSVLVSADSIGSLKKAYPNYFVDTEMFLESMNKIIA